MISGYLQKTKNKIDFNFGDLLVVYNLFIHKLEDSILASRRVETDENYLFDNTDHFLRITALELKFKEFSELFTEKLNVSIDLQLTCVKITYGLSQFIIVSHSEFSLLLELYISYSTALVPFVQFIGKYSKKDLLDIDFGFHC